MPASLSSKINNSINLTPINTWHLITEYSSSNHIQFTYKCGELNRNMALFDTGSSSQLTDSWVQPSSEAKLDSKTGAIIGLRDLLNIIKYL